MSLVILSVSVFVDGGLWWLSVLSSVGLLFESLVGYIFYVLFTSVYVGGTGGIRVAPTVTVGKFVVPPVISPVYPISIGSRLRGRLMGDVKSGGLGSVEVVTVRGDVQSVLMCTYSSFFVML